MDAHIDWKGEILNHLLDDYRWWRNAGKDEKEAAQQALSNTIAGAGTLKDFYREVDAIEGR
ncbi:MAG: hypothetical protein KGL39_14095 [Patescibacteria group bacterium]|nr:hypothetical protein [Patescibacteria group bacterium]